ncbi:MAG: hypothetical protein LQ338_001806 [Usnochroma carphineum]|nr:MAG: hypothetical protein LQ338_001806 [Usnochroma carphineum]
MKMGKSKKPKSTKTDSTGENDVPAVPTTKETVAASPDHAEQEASPSQADATDFESFYLKQVTAEFADDLDKLRNASDFSEKSVPILIHALKATASVYSEEEKAKVMEKR